MAKRNKYNFYTLLQEFLRIEEIRHEGEYKGICKKRWDETKKLRETKETKKHLMHEYVDTGLGGNKLIPGPTFVEKKEEQKH